MPKIEQTIADQNVRSHTFHFVTPGDTETLKIPNACNLCHDDKSIEWAKAALEFMAGSLAVAGVAMKGKAIKFC